MEELQKSNFKVLLIFDGMCVLCNHTVNFIIKKDKDGIFCFTSNDSSISKKIFEANQININKLNSVVLYEIETGKIHTKSKALLKMTHYLSGISKFRFMFLFVPKLFADFFYGMIARYRYRLFGKLKACSVDTGLKDKYIY